MKQETRPNDQIRLFRENAGLSQQRLAELTGTTHQQIGKLERGERRLTVEWAKRISRALGVNVTDLIGDGEASHKETQMTGHDMSDDPELYGLVFDAIKAMFDEEGWAPGVKRIAVISMLEYQELKQKYPPGERERHIGEMVENRRKRVRDLLKEMWD